MSVLNPNRRILPGPSLLHELIKETDDDAIALEFLPADRPMHTITYGEFRSLSHSLTHLVRQSLDHYSTPQIVPVIIPQCPELYITWRAVLQAGGCFCPISPDVPSERLKFILNDVSAELILCNEETNALVRGVAGNLQCLSVALEDLKNTSRHDSDPARTCKIDPSSPAYVMYTSGSTGLPKGVRVSHASATQALLAHDEHIPSFKRFLQFAAPTFDVSIFEIFFPFFRGATLVARDREHMLADLPGTIKNLHADAAELTPTVAGTLLRTRDAAPCLKVLLTIGEMLTRPVVAEFGGDRDRPSMLFAMYGPTEAAIHCTIAPRVSATATVRVIGTPLATVTAFVLKDSTDLKSSPTIAPREEPGELAVAGQLADGYLNRPDQTRAAFVDLPDYGRVYLTGDRAVCNEKGELEILGRMSTGQVKLRGQRVELGEVEEVAAKTPGVSQTIAMVIEDALVLFAAGTPNATPAAIVATCRSWLPPFMRPNEVLVLGNAFPRLPSGKVNRRQLEQDYRAHERSNIPNDAPMTAAERTICSVLESELHRPLHRHEDLWASGMDSLRAIKAVSLLRLQFPSATIKTILSSNTLADLAAQLSRQNGHAINGHSVDLVEDQDAWTRIEDSVRKSLGVRADSKSIEVFPCTPIQIAMLAETAADPEVNFNRLFLTRHGITQDQMCEALCQLAESCPILRSGFVQTDCETMPFVMITWPKLGLHNLSLEHPLQVATAPGMKQSTVVCMHHALYDGWSWDLILDDLNAILDNQAPLGRPSFQYVSRAIRGRQDEATSDAAISYWTSLLNNCEHQSLPSLVSTRPAKAVRLSTQRFMKLSYAELSEVAADLHIGRQTIMQACWGLMLSAYTDSDDVIFGTVVSGRHAPIEGVSEVIGPCLATLPTRLRLGRVKTVRDLLTYIQRQNLDSVSHYDTPLRNIRSAAKLNSAHDMFDSIVVWQEGIPRKSSHRHYVESAGNTDALNYTAVVEVEPIGTKLQLKITANTLMLGTQQLELLVEHFDALMNSALAQPDQSLTSMWTALPLHLLSVANPSFRRFSGTFDLAESVRRWARTAPDRAAIKFVDDFDPSTGRDSSTTVSYAELCNFSTAMMRNLIDRHDIDADDLVCIYASKSVPLYTAILAVMMSGAGYMCIDHRTPPDRVQHILRQANCALVITDNKSFSPNNAVQTITFDQLSAATKPPSNGDRPRRMNASGDHLAYAVFTSGTTGVPKGVLMTRLNLASHLEYLSSVYPYDSVQDSLLQACSPAFDVSVFEIFWSWHVGVTLVAASNDVLFRDIEHFIDHCGITHLSMTPSVAALVDPDNVPNVKMLVTAGEPMNSKVFQQWSGRGLYQGYGPSETTNICNVRPRVEEQDVSNNVGPIFSNTSAFICKRLPRGTTYSDGLTLDDFELVPKGAVGEIWIGGDQVGRGYVDALLTRRSFFMHRNYGWLYRSGDIGRMLADGTFLILGREDDQAKLRGQRIELGEINHKLFYAGLVTDAATIIDASQKSSRLVSFVVLDKGVKAQSVIPELFQYLESSLPTYMIPDAIVRVEALWLTRQGKIDRGQLLKTLDDYSIKDSGVFWRQSDDDIDTESLEGRGLDIARALSETLGIPTSAIGPNTSFYQLGLDSLSSIRFSRQLTKQGLPHIDISTILRHPTTAGLLFNIQSDILEENSFKDQRGLSFAAADHSEYIHEFSKHNLEVETVLTCTDLQLSMLASSESGRFRSYRNNVLFQVQGNLDRLERAWSRVLDRQQLLRTAFMRHSSSAMPYVQVILKHKPLPWYNDSKTTHHHAAFATPDFEWYRLQVSATHDRWYLSLDMHHALYDAVAMDKLLQEVESVYHDAELDTPVPFGNYLDYAASLKVEVMKGFWKERLNDITPCRLRDLLKPEVCRDERRVDSTIKASLVSSKTLEMFAKQQLTTVLSCLQAALMRLLMSYHGASSICFGNVYSGRNLPVEGVAQVIGPCFNTLPVPARTEINTSNAALIQSLHDFNLDVLPFQPSSVRAIQQNISPDGLPLFDVLLLLQQTDQDLDQTIWQRVEEKGDMDFPFVLEIFQEVAGDQIQLKLHSNVADGEVLQQILDDFDQLLLDTVSYPEGIAYDARRPAIRQYLRSPRPDMRGAPAVASSGSDIVNSLSPLEMTIRDVMLELTSMEPREVTANTTIFKLGLDSINAVQLASKLRDQGFSISSAQILQGPSVGEIAATCSQDESAVASEKDAPAFDFQAFDDAHRFSLCRRWSLQDNDISAIRPCTPLQDGIISQYLQSGGKLYHNTIHFKLRTTTKLARAWERTVERHEMLRSGFVECEDTNCNFAMIVYKSSEFSVPWDTFEEGKLPKDEDSRPRSIEDPLQSLLRPGWSLRLDSKSRLMTLSMLHALYDAQSMNLILADLASFCLDEELTQTVPLNPTISSILSAARSDEAREFWSREENHIVATKFPNLHISNCDSSAFSMVEKTMDMPLAEALSCCAELDCTMQAVCQAAWTRILSAYTGQQRVTFGLVLSGRNLGDERDNAVFPCINTLPFSVSPGNEISELLRLSIATNTGLLSNQHTQLTSIKRWQGLENEVFDTILAFQKMESKPPVHTPWEIIEDTATAEYGISVEVQPDAQSNSLRLRLTFADGLMPREAGETVLRQFEHEASAIFRHGRGLEMKETSQILSILAPIECRLPCEVALLHEFVERKASRQPSSAALEFIERFDGEEVIKKTWSYAELEHEGNRIANLLLSSGAETGDLVATCFDKCAEASFAILGVLKAGCAYVAIDPGAPADRKNFILKDAGCKIMLTTTDQLSSFNDNTDLRYWAVDDLSTLKGVLGGRPRLRQPPRPGDTCYCLYTSGTTGTPKGCLISHESAVQAMTSFRRIFRGHWSTKSRWLQFASFHFDVSVLEQYWSWSVGICMTSAPRDLILEDLPTFLRLAKITHLDLTPSLAHLITPAEVPSLCDGVFIVGGEQVSQDIIDTWGDAGCLYNFYGPSEVTIGCTVHPRVRRGTKPTNIGQLWDNVGAMVLRPGTEQPVMRGAVGELCLTGVLVGKGYLNRPKLTLEKFAILDNGTQIYRTGDLVRLLHDDSFDFLGRIDDQVKLRGQRLEIGEINQVIKATTTALSGVATMVLKHPTQGKEHLVAFLSTSKVNRRVDRIGLVHDAEASELTRSVREHCTEKLPSYMVPSEILVVTNIPLSANNKVELKLLKKLYEDSDLAGGQGPMDRISLQPQEYQVFRQVAETIARRLHLSSDTIKPGSRLFELGLDSVSAIGLARALRTSGFEHASIQAVMRSPAVADLVHTLKQRQANNSAHEVEAAQQAIEKFAAKHRDAICAELGFTADRIENISPCTPLQESMISKATSSDSQDAVYFSQFKFELRAGINLDRLRDAWAATAKATSILRTHFVPTVDGCAQVVLAEETAPVYFGSRLSQGDDSFSEWVSGAKGFAVFAPWRVVVHHERDSPMMSLCMFHGLYDGISLDLLLERVARMYNSDDPAQNLDMNFHDILPYGPLAQPPDSKTFWQKAIADVRLLDCPATGKGTSKAVQTTLYSGALRLPGVEQASVKLGVTTPAIFHAAWLLCLARNFDVNPTLGMVVSGRSISHQHAEFVIGPMFNTIPCTIDDMRHGSTVHDLASECHKFNVDALAYQHSPLRQIAKWLGVDPSKGLFDSLFVVQRERLDAYEHNLWAELPSTSSPDYPLNLEVELKRNGTFVMTLVGKSHYLSKAQCQELLKNMVRLLECIDGGEAIPLPGVFCNQKAQRSSPEHVNDGRITDNLSEDAWTEESKKIRDELAALAAIDANRISPTRPSIFELGLDSIDAMKLATRLKRAGIRVPISAIMRYPTVAGIAAASGRAEQEDKNSSESDHGNMSLEGRQNQYRKLLQAEGLDLSGVECVLPVTALQGGLLLAYEKYYNVMPLALAQSTDLELLKQAWQETAARIAMLRMRFVVCEGETKSTMILQAIMRTPQLEIEERTATDAQSAVAMLKKEAAERGFAMPVVKILFTKEESQTVMLLGLPHAAYDGWSLQLIHQELFRNYYDLANGNLELDTEAQTPQSHLEVVLKEAGAPKTQRYWSRAVEATHPTLLSPGTDSSLQCPSQLLQRASDVPLSAAERFCQQAGVTMQSLGLAAWSCYLANETVNSNVCFGLVLAGRTTEGSDRLIFPTFNTVLFNATLRPEQSARQVVRTVHSQALGIGEHQHFPLQETLRLARQQFGHAELFNSLFTYQKGPSKNAETTELYTEIEFGNEMVDPPFAVNVELEVKQGKLMWTLASQENILSSEDAVNILRTLDSLLAKLVLEPDESVFGKEEQRKLITTSTMSDKRADLPAISSSPNLTSTERIVRDVLAEVSKMEVTQVSKTTNIFNLGLDSISAIKLSSKLKSRGLKLAISKIIENQTVEKMAAAAKDFSSSTTGSEIASEPTERSPRLDAGQYATLLDKIGIAQDDIEEVLPATAGQQYMLDVWRASGGKLLYPTFWFETSSTVEAFNAAMDQLVASQPMLRITFIHNGTQALQVRLTPAAAHTKKGKLSWVIRTQHRTGTDNLFINLCIHHALYDAVSLRVLVEQLNRLCRGSSPIPQNDHFDTFITATHSLSSAVQARQRGFWTQYLQPGLLPSQQSAPAHTGSFARPRISQFTPRLHSAEKLLARLRKEGVSAQALFFALVGRVYAASLGFAAESERAPKTVVLGIYMSNRALDIEGLPSLAAPTVNVVPLYVGVHGPVWETATRVQRDLGEIGRAERCGVSLREVWQWTGVKIGCVVNWLGLPDGEETEQGENEGEEMVWHASEEVKREMGVDVHAGDEVGEAMDRPSPFMGDDKAPQGEDTAWVVPSIDIEAKIEDGYLTMGLFGPEDLVGGGAGVQSWFRAVKQGLARVEGNDGEGGVEEEIS